MNENENLDVVIVPREYYDDLIKNSVRLGIIAQKIIESGSDYLRADDLRLIAGLGADLSRKELSE